MKTSQNLKIIGIICLAFIILNVNNSYAKTDVIDLDEYTVEYTYDEEDAKAGEKLTVGITITNEDTVERTDITFELDENYPFNIIGDDMLEIDSLAAGESKKRTFRLDIDENAKDDKYDLDFTLEDKDDDYDDTIEIKVKSILPEIIIGNIQSSPSLITPDTKDVKLTVTLENTGDGSANFVKVKLVTPENINPSSSYSDIANVGTISSGSSKDVIFYVDVDKAVSEGINQAKVEIEYKDEDDNKKTGTLTFDIPIKGKPQFNIIGTTLTPVEITPGMKAVDMKIIIKNIGTTKGEETSVRVFENSDQPFTFNQKTNFIGTLESQESGTGVFSFDVDSNANPNTYLVKVQIRTLNEGTVLVTEETVPVKVVESEKNPLSIIIPIVSLGLVILIVFLFIKFRKK